MDSSSIILALELQQQDLETWESSLKGKQRAGEKTDSELALEACRNELNALAAHVSDQTLALSIARAVRTDGHAIEEAQATEKQAVRDHQIALNLSANPNPKVKRNAAKKEKDEEEEDEMDSLDDELIAILQSMNLYEDQERAESSSWAASRKPSQTRECIACSDQFPPLALSRSPCSHEYCRGCLVSLVQGSLKDESLFPPRCCGQHIPIKSGRWFSPELVGKFKAKKLEFETPNRIYCSEPTCSTFVPPIFIVGDKARCPKCDQSTCVTCKGHYHNGLCMENTASRQLLRLAAENGWQQCFACHRLVELNYGCYHITCKCRAEFCYICGKRWKTCKCPHWEERRLMDRANEFVNRAGDADRINERERHLRIEQEMINLMENHECTHQRWKGRPGPHECEECNQVMPLFIYECRQCHISACRRCRFNRL